MRFYTVTALVNELHQAQADHQLPQGLHRLDGSRLAATHGVIVVAIQYRLGALGRPLRSGAENSVTALTLMAGDDMAWGAWGELTHSVRTGEPAFDRLAVALAEAGAQGTQESVIYGFGLQLNPEVESIFDFKFEDFRLLSYDPHPHIPAPVAI